MALRNNKRPLVHPQFLQLQPWLDAYNMSVHMYMYIFLIHFTSRATSVQDYAVHPSFSRISIVAPKHSSSASLNTLNTI